MRLAHEPSFVSFIKPIRVYVQNGSVYNYSPGASNECISVRGGSRTAAKSKINYYHKVLPLGCCSSPKPASVSVNIIQFKYYSF